MADTKAATEALGEIRMVGLELRARADHAREHHGCVSPKVVMTADAADALADVVSAAYGVLVNHLLDEEGRAR